MKLEKPFGLVSWALHSGSERNFFFAKSARVKFDVWSWRPPVTIFCKWDIRWSSENFFLILRQRHRLPEYRFNAWNQSSSSDVMQTKLFCVGYYRCLMGLVYAILKFSKTGKRWLLQQPSRNRFCYIVRSKLGWYRKWFIFGKIGIGGTLVVRICELDVAGKCSG